MTKDEIMRMAREAKLPDPMVFYASIERFAAMVAAAERKACAKIGDGYDYGERNCGEEIRARGNA